MFNAIHKRLRKDDRGFTLIELMVVVLIIAILIAIAIPTFLGARKKAQDRAAQSDLRQGLLTAKTYYTDNEQFLDVAAGGSDATTATQYAALEPSLTFVATAAAQTKSQVGVHATGIVLGVSEVLLVKQSSSGKWFCVHDSTSGPTKYLGADTYAAVDTTTECNGTSW